jgi:uncharacterized repeat protein (TIGR03803 family)
MSKLNWGERAYAAFLLCAATAIALPAQTLTTLHSLGHNAGPSQLVQATDGNLYGTTYRDGVNGNYGTIFRITLSGKLKTLHSFDGTDGAESYGLIQATNGKLYGTTYRGGANGFGTVFRLSVGLGPNYVPIRATN